MTFSFLSDDSLVQALVTSSFRVNCKSSALLQDGAHNPVRSSENRVTMAVEHSCLRSSKFGIRLARWTDICPWSHVVLLNMDIGAEFLGSYRLRAVQ